MKNIVIFAPRQTSAVTVLGPMEVFYLAGEMGSRLPGLSRESPFSVKLASIDGEPVPCLNRTSITPHCSIADVKKADTVLVGSLTGDIKKALAVHEGVPAWLERMAKSGAEVASACTGAFLLAEAGLLDGKSATTHWAWAEEFTKRYPKVRFCPEKTIVHDGSLSSSGGANACFDLALALVSRYCGRELGIKTAKFLLHDTGRSFQAPYSLFFPSTSHGDPDVARIQEFLNESFRNHVGVDELAQRFGLGRRTLERRFKAATGLSPLGYLQQVRLSAAKGLLEESSQSFDEIAWKTGYGDSGFFRKLFEKQTGVTPREYRKKFAPQPV